MIAALLLAAVARLVTDCRITFEGDFNFHASRANALTVLTQGPALETQGFVVWTEREHGLTQYLIFPWSAAKFCGASSTTYLDLAHPGPNSGAEVTGTGYAILWDGEMEVGGVTYKADQFNPKVYPPVRVQLK